MRTVFNFSAGPAVLPEEVLLQLRAELLDCRNSGQSAMESSHRAEPFTTIAREAEEDLRALLGLTPAYRVLFLQGGASSQFTQIPLNLLEAGQSADYVNTGYWSQKAIEEARRGCAVNVVASSEANQFRSLPDAHAWKTDPTAGYLHYTPNETIHGVEFHWIPHTEAPLVADMSSTLLSRPLDVSHYGLIYAGAQKNIGPAGLTLVIVREDLLRALPKSVSPLYSYKVQAEQGSMVNTPPTFAWYAAGLVFKWLKAQGGLAAMGTRNQRKAGKLYAAIDGSDFYRNAVESNCRSWMNVPFSLAQPERDGEFLAAAEAAGLKNLKGHRAAGGCRASLYNAMPEAGVDALIAFMRDFEVRKG